MRSTAADHQNIPDLLIPDGRAEIVFVLAGGYDVFDLAGGPQRTVSASSFSGLQTRTLAVRRRSPVHLLGIKLAPATGYRLFGAAAAQAVDHAVPLEQIAHPGIQELARSLQREACTDEFAIESTCAALTAMLTHQHPGLATLTSAMTSIAEAADLPTVAALAREAHLSSRQLRRHFATVVGLSPKQLLTIHRFRRYYADLLAQDGLPHPTAYGYYDQAHHIHDVRRRLGTTPAGFSERVFREAHEIARLSTSGASRFN